MVGLDDYLLESADEYREEKINFGIVKQVLFNHIDDSKSYLKRVICAV